MVNEVELKISHSLKKSIIALFTLSFVFLYAFSANTVDAAVGSQEIDVTLNLECGGVLPGAPPFVNPLTGTFKATAPERVAAGEEFYLTNTTFVKNLGLVHFDNLPPMEAGLESPNYRIVYGDDVVRVFSPDTDIIVPPGTAYDFPFTFTDGEDIGPFVVHENGEVTLKFDEFRMNVSQTDGEFTIAIGYVCPVPEDADFTLATVTVDGEAPVLTLNGDSTMIVKQGDPFNDPGATAQDNYDGDLTDEIEVSGEVDTGTIGTYTLTYTVSDSVGNVTTVDRTVEVVEPFGDWLTGEGAPSAEIGTNGDSYLDLTTGDVYKRDPNTWNLVGNLKGDDGKQGSEILTGSGAPSADAGDNGDLYLDTATGDVYQKTNSSWNLITNLQGPEGPQGPAGKGGSGDGSGSGDGDGSDKKSDDGTKVSVKGDNDKKGSAGKGGKLPKTATSLPTLILVGSLLVAIGGILFLRRRKAIE